ncbi:MAG: translation repressor protein [Alphaproteobacteria bacterium TMED194]|nr:MAG: translation repressor protein [Alphaproteobacteria bacterium TMED194]|tara:strand:- start:1152 stop:1583 length:432 start_codon:yes stop_codon:yes gene_type:complete
MENVKWSREQMLEVTLKQPDDFLKVRETLSRIGVASRKEKKLYQSCHILHKQGKYYIVHFKELFALDGKETNLSENDIGRRNRIASLLSDWGLVSIIGKTEPIAPLSQIKIISFKEKSEWNLETKYNIGKTKEVKKDANEQSI